MLFRSKTPNTSAPANPVTIRAELDAIASLKAGSIGNAASVAAVRLGDARINELSYQRAASSQTRIQKHAAPKRTKKDLFRGREIIEILSRKLSADRLRVKFEQELKI